MSQQTGVVLIPGDVGIGWGCRQSREMAENLGLRLNQAVVACNLEDSAAPLTTVIEVLVNAGNQRLVLVPVGLIPLSDAPIVRRSIAWAKRKWPFLELHIAAPLTWLDWSAWLRVTASDAVNELVIQSQEAAVVLVGQSCQSALTNANLPRLAHLVQEQSALAYVTHAFTGDVRPGILEAIRDLVRKGCNNVIVVPWLFNEGEPYQQLLDGVEQATRALDLRANVKLPSLAHAAFLNVLVANFCTASPADFANPVPADDHAGTSIDSVEAGINAEEAFELRELSRKINALLPAEYQGKYEDVTPRSMGSATLKFHDAGKVAWDEIWTSFCDLALAGGPPHRGSLLEAVTAAEANAEPEQYQAVVAEIERGIRLVTALPVVASKVPGWVGVRCESEEMAIWLMRAIIVENIMVRREGEVLYLPAGPRFTLYREIKNVITAIAKTVHYWTAHLAARRASYDRDLS